MEDKFYKELLIDLNKFAEENTTCKKVAVGSLYLDDNNNVLHRTCNKSSDKHNCKDLNECYKAKVTGVYESVEWTRKYCKSKHSEIWMIEMLNNLDVNPEKGTLLVTRYPCESCANAIIKFGIKKVVYGGKQEISDEVKNIFDKYKVTYIHYPDVDYENYEQYKKN